MNIVRIMNLTPMQEGILYQCILNEDPKLYNEQLEFDLEGSLDISVLKESAALLVKQFEILRTTFVYQDVKRNQQVVLEKREVPFVFEDLSAYTKNEADEFISSVKKQEINKGFHLTNNSLIRFHVFQIATQKYHVLFGFHHIILDGWSLGLLIKRWFSNYAALAEGRALTQASDCYKHFLNQIQSLPLEPASRYWNEYLNGFERKTIIPFQKGELAGDKYDLAEVNVSIPAVLRLGLDDIARNNNVTSSLVYQVLLAVLLQKYNRTEDVIFGSVVSGRQHNIAGIQEGIGLFINTMPVRSKYSPDSEFINILREQQQSVLSSEENAYISLADIQAMANIDGSLFDVLYAYENYPLDQELRSTINANGSMGDFNLSNSRIIEQTNYDFNFTVLPSADDSTIRLTYNRSKYVDEYIKAIPSHFINIAYQVCGNPQMQIGAISLVSAEEQGGIFKSVNDYTLDISDYTSVIEVFERKAKQYPDNIAVSMENNHMTYAQLNYRANQLAKIIQTKDGGKNGIIPLLLDKSMDMIIAILAVQKAGYAYLPIDPSFPVDRIKYMILDSGEGTVISTTDHIEEMQLKDAVNLDTVSLEAVDDINLKITRSTEALLYVIYTSGTTGKPKGTMVTHGNVLSLLMNRHSEFDFHSNDVWSFFHSYCFDFSVWEMYGALLYGGRLVIIGKDAARDSAIFYEMVDSENITVLNQTPSAFYNFCEVDKLQARELPNLRYVIFGGEALHPGKLQAWYAQHLQTKLINMYGITETTVHVTYKLVTEKDISSDVSNIGKPINSLRLYILDEEMNPVPCGVPGEICVSGGGVSKGYLNNAELTENRFVENPFIKHDIIYKSGDLGCVMLNGDIQYIGRSDDQLQIRGYRVEKGEIESVLLQYPGINNVIVTEQKRDDTDVGLVGYIVADHQVNIDELRSFLSLFIPEYMIPAFIVQIDEIALNANGKADIRVLPPISVAHEDNRLEPRDEIEKALANIWIEALQADNISINDNFFQLGGHSVIMMRIIAAISREMKVKVSFKEFMNHITIEQLAGYIRGCTKTEEPNPLLQVFSDEKHFYDSFPLTDIQLSYLLGRGSYVEMGGVSTHLYLEIDTVLDIERLSVSFQKVIDRHPMLRAIINDSGEQVFLKNSPQFVIRRIDISRESAERQEEMLQENRERMSHHIFDTSTWPMFEFTAFTMNDEVSKLCIGFDPIIADAGSMRIIGYEWMAYYKDLIMQLPRLEFTFRDYVIALNNLKTTEKYQEDKQYWLQQLDEFPLAPVLPMIMNPTAVSSPKFHRLTKTISKDKWKKIKQFTATHNVTPLALFFLRYAETLAYWSNQQEFAINFTVANRIPFHPDVNNIVGDFTSLMIIDVEIDGQTVADRLQYIQNVLLSAIEHRNYDGVDFIRELAKRHSLTNKAIMPIVFTGTLNDRSDAYGWDDLGAITAGINQTSQVYLDNQILELADGVSVTWDYVEQLFDPEMMETMFNQYINGLEQFSHEIEYKPSSSGMTLLQEYNDSKKTFNTELLHVLFEKSVDKYSDHIAVKHGEQSASYKTLDTMANQVASKLKAQGVKRNTKVGIISFRNIETIAALLGILKAGAAYIPIDPELPDDRKQHIVKNSGCVTLITEEFFDDLEQYSGQTAAEYVSEDDVAYIIYTSGSTGQPKGVVIKHQAAANTIIDINQRFAVTEKDRILGISSMGFDLSVYDIFGAFAAGACLVLIDSQKDIKNIVDVVETEGITIWNSVPAIMDLVINKLEIENSEDREILYYWAPGKYWRLYNGYLMIGERTFDKIDEKMAKNLYFAAQRGATKQELYNVLDNGSASPNHLFDQLVSEKILVHALMDPLEVFKAQEQLYANPYGEEVIFDSQAAKRYKQESLFRKFTYSGEKIQLPDDDTIAKPMYKRKSLRKFSEMPISETTFSRLMTVLKQFEEEQEIRYCYASAGGLYPIDIYIHVKNGRVDNIAEGVYYYSPVDNSLELIPNAEIDSDFHYFENKQIFTSSAFSFLLVYNARANMSKYQSLGYFQACIDTGILVGTITQAAEQLDMGICSIGNMDFDKVRKSLKLKAEQIPLHGIEIGMKPEANIQKRLTSVFTRIVEPNYQNKLSSLRVVMLSGDWIPMNLCPKIKEYCPGANIYSLGGATEGSIWSIYYPVKEMDSTWNSIPYGYPLANQTMHILNGLAQQCPVNVPGEIYIGGKGVASGYDNDIEKTKAQFIQHPRYGYLYRTGDYGVMRPQGYMEFLGRKDFQVKIQGMRIELEEIENTLLAFCEITSAKAVVREKENGKFLYAYYTSPIEYDDAELRTFLQSKLPKYMVPNSTIYLEYMPLTSNGKVDVRKLLSIDKKVVFDKRDKSHIDKLPAGNRIEKDLHTIWKKVLGVDEFGLDDNFFDLGGNSVMLIQAHAQIDRKYPNIVKMIEIFNYPSIRKLAEIISVRTGQMQVDHSIYETSKAIDDSLFSQIKMHASKANVATELVMIGFQLMYYAKKCSIDIVQAYYALPNEVQEMKIDFSELSDMGELYAYIDSEIAAKKVVTTVNRENHDNSGMPYPIFYHDSYVHEKQFSCKEVLPIWYQMVYSGIRIIVKHDSEKESRDLANEMLNEYIAFLSENIS